ncbi:MAG: glycosyltransferase [Sulfurovaceae bacterium]|nr:glycosyltransferase [Sulfurovaceae bacterium]
MKALIIGNYKSVFAKELQSELALRKIDVYLLDFETLKLYKNTNIFDESYCQAFDRYRKLPKIHMVYRMYYIAKFLRSNFFDVVNIHTARVVYASILPFLTKQKLVVTVYGSDFYRMGMIARNIQKLLYKKADVITFTNPLTKQGFLDYYDDFEVKSRVCRFGLKTLDFIDKNRNKDRLSIKEHLGYSLDKIIVTCGYNATKGQQHEKIIENILKLNTKILDKIQFIFPMTYGDKIHKDKIKKILQETSLDYKVLENFLFGDDNAYIKLASDVMINILHTDSFSGSMQEFLYANNIVITGSWLPYKIFDQLGIYYHKIDFLETLADKLMEVLSDMDKEKTVKNVQIIHLLSSWDNNIQSWIEAYEN